MSEPVKKCTEKQWIDYPHDWVLHDKPTREIILKSGKIRRTRHLLCSICKGQMVETAWIVNGKRQRVKLDWKEVGVIPGAKHDG